MTKSSSRPSRTRHRKCEDAKPGSNIDESPLAWLARRKDKDGLPMISDAEFNAGEKLRADFFFAAMTPQVTTNWARLLSGDSRKAHGGHEAADLTDAVLAARDRVHVALQAVGPELAGLLIDVCCHLRRLEGLEKAIGWPQRSGKVVLGIALGRLASHYGMLPCGAAARSGRISHWGAADYRPSIDPEAGSAGETP